VYDLLDSVCGRFDRRFAGAFLRAGVSRVTGISVTNVGSWRQAIAKYRRQDRLRAVMRELCE
jgi:hypothetical protein